MHCIGPIYTRIEPTGPWYWVAVTYATCFVVTTDKCQKPGRNPHPPHRVIHVGEGPMLISSVSAQMEGKKHPSSYCGRVPEAAVVVVASFIINVLYCGSWYISGIYYESFLDTFGASKRTTAWTISIQSSVVLLSG